ncbi:uncharacterized protein K02A2.6-like [Morus notabilis]|uniref:uncharacterized protein K02A2.6-like n=1 Tax=Morus notabilis TaxID=981085 RepID=UPI000CED11D4|nr:uncharacterized protein K02A2.6-like [Morus notabilis]
MNPERYEALKEEVDKLINNGFIRESHYPRWVSNPVLVIKPNGNWRTCVDFSDLNKACPKDGFPFPRIDQLVDATAGHEMLSFMDAYSGYNQIPMHPADEEHTSFITDRGLYCYKGQPSRQTSRENVWPAPAASGEDEVTKWKLYVDGASSENGSGAGVLLISPECHKITSAVRFKFKASNKDAEYEALIAGLRLASHLKIERLSVFSDSQLVVAQVKEEYQARGEKMGAYLRKVKEEFVKFKNYEILQIPRTENVNADALTKLAFSRESDTLGVVPIEELERPTIEEKVKALIVRVGESWMTPLIQYLMDAQLPNDKDEARRIRDRAARYLLYDGLLYRRGYSTLLQRCLDEAEAQKVLHEIHEGICGNHTGGQSLALKVLRQGYYWPTLKKDAFQYARRCDKCQRYATIPRAPLEHLTSILSPWPFAKWGVDLIGLLHLAPGGFKFAIVAVDYYTKWTEAKALATTTEAACTKFMWDYIVCRFGVLHSIVSDNGKQFDNASTRRFCDGLGFQKDFSAPIHPQSNGQVEAVNKILKYTLKKKLDDLKGKWAEELPKVLWAYRTMSQTTTGETPFSMAYGVKAVLPIEI